MNQQALSSVLLRVYGIYIVYSTISVLSGGLLMQTYSYWNVDSEGAFSFIAIMSTVWFIQFVFGIVLIIASRKISKFCFPENLVISEGGTINESVLFHIGICLVGIWFLISNLPSFLLQGFAWFKTQATNTAPVSARSEELYGPSSGISYDHLPYYTIMVVLSLILIFRSKSLANWIFRCSK